MSLSLQSSMPSASELRDVVNEQLLAIAEDGTMLKIAENYVDSGLVLEGLCLIK